MDTHVQPSEMWSKVFRPATIEDMGLDESVRAFYDILFATSPSPNDGGNLPRHASLADCPPCAVLPQMILYGPPGTGKSTLVKIITRRFFCEFPELEVTNVSVSNASSERGIANVRSNIMAHAKFNAACLQMPSHYAHISCAQERFDYYASKRIIVLEECDNMTDESQEALRKIIESSAEHVTFILVCNNVHQLIGALRSRARRIMFRLTMSCAQFIVRNVCTSYCSQLVDIELGKALFDSLDANLISNNTAMKLLVDSAHGDARPLVSALQSIVHQVQESGVTVLPCETRAFVALKSRASLVDRVTRATGIKNGKARLVADLYALLQSGVTTHDMDALAPLIPTLTAPQRSLVMKLVLGKSNPDILDVVDLVK